MKSAIPGWPLGEPLPALLTSAELMRVLRMRPATFYAYKKAGQFKRFETKVPMGRAIYSGAVVQQYLDGESTVRFGAGSRRSA